MAKSRFLRLPQVRLLVSACALLATALVVAMVSDRCAADDEQLSEIERLSLDQSRIADNYSRLEQTIIRMAEIEALSNPQRASLLKRAVQQSSERLTRTQLNTVVKLLTPPAKLKRAIDDQEQALKDLRDLLELLLSEDRSERRKDRRDQISEYIKEVVRLIRLQRGLEGRTQNADDPKKLAGNQERVAERTARLAQKIEESEAGEHKDGDPKDGEPKDGEPKDGEPKDGEDASGEGNSPPPPESENPAHKRIRAAEERMREAQQKLEEAKRDDAVIAQEEARRELEKAKEELEEILRQLREEEVEHALAMLEGRFRRMLESQLRIYESTKRLEKIAADDRGRQVDIQASKLGFDESKLAVDADKALLLLVAEGSSVAFPETVQQMRDEMRSVADRLAEVKVGLITQTAEEEIIAALEDMIAALQQAQQDMEEKKQSQPPQQSTPINPEDIPLVDQIAELKMIRGLQIRINTRTKRYARLLKDIDDPVGATTDADLRRELFKLAERQKRIYRVTRDIEIGKNRQ